MKKYIVLAVLGVLSLHAMDQEPLTVQRNVLALRPPTLQELCCKAIANESGKKLKAKKIKRDLTSDALSYLITEQTGINNSYDAVVKVLHDHQFRFPITQASRTTTIEDHATAKMGTLQAWVDGGNNVWLQENGSDHPTKLSFRGSSVHIAQNSLIFTHLTGRNEVYAWLPDGTYIRTFSSSVPLSDITLSDDCKTIIRHPYFADDIEYRSDITRFHQHYDTMRSKDIEEYVSTSKSSLTDRQATARETVRDLNAALRKDKKRTREDWENQ